MTDLTARCPASCDAPENLAHCHDCAWQVMSADPAQAREREDRHRYRRHDAPEPTTDEVCDSMWNRHDRQRAVIVQAIEAVALVNGGQVDMNAVRDTLASESVVPQLVGAVVNVLLRQGRLVEDGWTTNTDKRGRNAGRPSRLYRLVNNDRSVSA